MRNISLNDLQVLSVLRGGKAHGYAICQKISKHKPFALGSLYNLLAKMEKAGLIIGQYSASQKHGARRRYYRITKKGSAVQEKEMRSMLRLWEDNN